MSISFFYCSDFFLILLHRIWSTSFHFLTSSIRSDVLIWFIFSSIGLKIRDFLATETSNKDSFSSVRISHKAKNTDTSDCSNKGDASNGDKNDLDDPNLKPMSSLIITLFDQLSSEVLWLWLEKITTFFNALFHVRDRFVSIMGTVDIGASDLLGAAILLFAEQELSLKGGGYPAIINLPHRALLALAKGQHQ